MILFNHFITSVSLTQEANSMQHLGWRGEVLMLLWSVRWMFKQQECVPYVGYVVISCNIMMIDNYIILFNPLLWFP